MVIIALELGSAYVDLMLSTSKTDSSVKKAFSGIEKQADKTSKGASKSFAGGIGGSLVKVGKVGGLAIAGIGAAVAGIAIKGGISRALQIEDAQAKLTGLGHSTKSVDTIMTNALASVKGTAFGLGDAATAAASAVASGVKPGKDLTRTLKLTGDAATIAGVGYGDMASIMNKAAASNKVQGDILAQLGDMGIPIVQLLGKEMGLTAEEVYTASKKGTISFENLQSAIESGMGGAALASGKTFRGAMANTFAALGRIGETVVKPFLTLIKAGFNAAIPVLDAFNDAIKPGLTTLENYLGKKAPGWFAGAGAAATGFVTEAIGGIRAFAAAWHYNDGEITSAGFPGFMERVGYIARQVFGEIRGGLIAFAAAWKYNDGEITSSGFPGFMERAGYIARQVWGELTGGIKAFSAAWKYNDGEVTSSGFPGMMERLANTARAVQAAFQKLDFSSWNAFTSSLGSGGAGIGASLGSIGESFKTLMPAFKEFGKQLPNLGPAFAKLAAGGITVLGKVLGFLADHVDTIIKYMPLIVAAFVAWRIASAAAAKGTFALQAAQLAMTPVITLNNVLRLTAIRLEGAQTKALAGSTIAQVKNNTAQNAGVIGKTRYALALVAQKIGTIGSTAAMWAQTAAQKALNLAMKANPIMIVVGVIALLVGALVWLYKNNQTARTIIDGAWTGIKNAVSFAWNKVIKPAFNAIVGFVKNTLGPIFTWLRDNVFKPVWTGIRIAVAVAWVAISLIFKAISWYVKNVLGPIFTWLRDYVIKPIWSGIKATISVAWAAIKIIFAALKWYVQNVLGPIFTWLRDKVIKPVWNGIKSAISTVWNKGIKPIFQALGSFIKKHVAPAFEAGVSLIGKAWEKIQSVVSGPIDFVVNTVIQKGIVETFNKVATKLGIAEKYRLPDVHFAGFKKAPSGGHKRSGGPKKFFDVGGYTGPGSKYQPAGVVHADEFVLRKEATNKLRSRFGLAGLNHMNRTGQLPDGYSSGGLVKRPVGGRVTSGFGAGRAGGSHAGIDFAVPIGTAVKAALAGVVSRAGWNAVPGRSGKGMLLDHPGGRQTYYGHLSAFVARLGQSVAQGQTIAKSGNTGNSTGPHLHFETWSGGKPLNPARFLGGDVLPEGVGGGGGFNPFAFIGGLKDKLIGKIQAKLGDNPMAAAGIGMASKLVGGLSGYVSDKLASFTDIARDIGGKVAGSAKMTAWATAALSRTGDLNPFNLASLLRRMQQESGGNPNAVNNWDSNAKRGTPSKGLMQVIGPTFAQYRDKSLSSNIMDPIANIVASINYTKSRYGSLRAGWDRKGGYADGGLVSAPFLHDKGGWHAPGTMSVNQLKQPEAILTPSQWNNISKLAEQGMTGAMGREVRLLVGEREFVAYMDERVEVGQSRTARASSLRRR